MDRSLQYMQLDFLRLFRIGKALGAFKRKRKMPTEYAGTGNSITSAHKSIVKIAKEVIDQKISKEVFNDCRVNYDTIYMYLKPEVRTKLNNTFYLIEQRFDELRNDNTPDGEFIRNLNAERRSIYGFQEEGVRINFPNYVSMNITYKTFIVDNTTIYYSTGYKQTMGCISLVDRVYNYLSLLDRFEEFEQRYKLAEEERERLKRERATAKKSKAQAIQDQYPEALPAVRANTLRPAVIINPVAAGYTATIPVEQPVRETTQSLFNNALNRWRQQQ